MTKNTDRVFPYQVPLKTLSKALEKANKQAPPIITPPPKEEIDRLTAEVLAGVAKESGGSCPKKDLEKSTKIIQEGKMIHPDVPVNVEHSILKNMIQANHPVLKAAYHNTQESTNYTPEKIKDPWS